MDHQVTKSEHLQSVHNTGRNTGLVEMSRVRKLIALTMPSLVMIGLFFILFSTPVTVNAQCPSTGFSDGCSSAPTGTIQFPHLLDIQMVTQLNVIAGTGYTNGTYTWTATGCTGSGATGTITVAGGKLAGATSQQYTISNEGTGYTCRPTIAIPSGASGGSGGQIVPTVYQARPAWAVCGVDYYCGVPSGTSFADPSTTLPSGATYASNVVTVTGCNVTLNALDFTLHSGIMININVTSSSCATTVTNSKFAAFAVNQPIIFCTNLGTSGSLVFNKNNYDGLAATGGTGSGFNVNDPIECQGTVSMMYNYFHNFDSKVIQMGGLSGAPVFTEKYNLFSNFGYCSTPPCSHGEAEYTFGSGSLKVDFEYNTYNVAFTSSGHNDLTAPHAIQADSLNITGTTDLNNVVLAPGPQNTCDGGNANAYTASGVIYNGDQEGGTLSGTTFKGDYVDNSATFFPWYNDYTSGHTALTVGPNNIDAGSGSICGDTTATTFPGIPLAFHTTSVGSTTVAFAWTAAAAGTHTIANYKVYRNGTSVGTPSGTTFTDSSASNGTTYYYTISAIDSSANEGGQSGFIVATTTGGGGGTTIGSGAAGGAKAVGGVIMR